jgi:adenine-specific DNA-methyltransferase
MTEPKTGRRYATVPIHAPGIRQGVTGKPWKGLSPPKGRHWAFVPETLDKYEEEGRIEWSRTGNPRLKMYADECPSYPIQDIWIEFKDTGQTLYSTQKPETLLERIIRTSSNENDLVLDCFVGSGTTAAVAEKLNRRWIACDLGRFAIHTTRKRLLSIPDVRPFVVQNLGKYKRQLWQTGQFAVNGPETPEQATKRHRAYVDFILQLYHATPLHGRTWLHGVKGGCMVHVGGVEGPVTAGDVTHIAAEFKKAMGTGKDAPTTNGVDVLGWDFAFEINEVSRQQAEAANIHMRFTRLLHFRRGLCRRCQRCE